MMDDSSAYELTHAITQLVNKLDTSNAQQEETNDLIRHLISKLSDNSQELQELREELEKQKKG